MQLKILKNKSFPMWNLLYNSLKEFEVKDINIHDYKNDNSVQKILSDICDYLVKEKCNENTNISVILYQKKAIGYLYGSHILNLKIDTFYSELVQTVLPIETTYSSIKNALSVIINRIIKEKDSLIAPKELKILQEVFPQQGNMSFTNNIYCIDSSDFSKLRLYHICHTRYFKQIKNKYSKKWNTIVSMKDFTVTKLFYKKHLLIGFSLYRKEDGEQFFWSGQFQEVLESLIIKIKNND
ncbi:hypothetical protein [Zobellia barbeyronii]|uniref:Uncharacterized protein n=1 Tax=Zobellia barbeyronii TaxID=2748009 RepID=A0ABS5WA86_9FLAO|nr:hypothetical protein [Zobellia barbeyronii]MBT2160257.1 hypothetical protein [Zobellia barbeyronii]